MRRSNYFLSVSAAALIASFAGSVCEADPAGFFLNAEGAWVIPMQSTQTYTVAMPNTPLPDLLDDYVSNKIAQSGSLGVGFGYQFAHPNWAGSCWLPNYRLSAMYDYFTNATVSGYVEKYQQVQAYDMSYKVSSQVLWLDGQADVTSWKAFTPYVELGFGAAANNSHGYNETPLTDQPRIGAAFADHTVTQFAYRVGAGVNYPWQIKHRVFNVGLGYQFVDLGHAQTGASANYPTASAGIREPIKASELLLSIRSNL